MGIDDGLDDYGVSIDADLVNQDFDDIDLYGEIMEEEAPETDIIFD